MTSAELLDLILLDFEPALRSRALAALNNRYAHLWNLEDWTFRYSTVNPTTAANTLALAGLPADFGVVVNLWNELGDRLAYVTGREFYDRYLPTVYGQPEAFTVTNGQILLGPIPIAVTTWTLHYRKRLTLLADGIDVPAIPAEYHLALVHGARAELLATYDPDGGAMEQLWQLDIQAMAREYLSDVEGEPAEWGADPTWRSC